MSQEKVNKHKNAKQNQKKIQKRKNIKKMLWIIAGTVIFGGLIGFFLGKFWLYPTYREKAGYDTQITSDQQNPSNLNNQILQELNRQIQEENSGAE